MIIQTQCLLLDPSGPWEYTNQWDTEEYDMNGNQQEEG